MQESQTFVSQLRDYRKVWFGGDLMAGITVAVMLIPQGMAYSMLAGLPPVYGLYAALVPLLVYPFFGSSTYLSVGPVALVSIIVLTGLSELAEPFSEEFIQLAILTSLIAGLIQVLLSLFRMGFLVNFLSHPVISGFTSAAAFIIAVSQVKHLLGVPVPSGSTFIETISTIVQAIPNMNNVAFVIGVSGILLIVALKRVNRSIPGALVAIVLAIMAVTFLDLESREVAIVGEVPSGLPAFGIPEITMERISQVLPLSLVICLISFIESLAIAKALASKNAEFGLDANKELMGLGLAKVVGSFFLAFPNTGSFSRSAINEQAGARTGLSSIIAALVVGLTLLFFTGMFYYLPNAVLASIVISAVIGLVDVKEAVLLFKTHKRDFVVLLLTFVLTLLLGIQKGVFVGVVISLLFILRKVSKPHYAVLGKLKDSGRYRNVERFKEAVVHDDQLIFRYDDDIFFGNAEHFYNTVLEHVSGKPGISDLVLDLSSVSSMDSTGLHQFTSLVQRLETKGIIVHICGLKGPLRDFFNGLDIDDVIGAEQVHWDINDAMDNIDQRLDNKDQKTPVE